jgi:ribosome-binding protein aMBF1 (putative translation factor)
MDKQKINKIGNSFYSDLDKNLKDKKFKKTFYDSLLKLQIANEIIKFREKRNITQKELAEKINTTQAVISRIENGQVCASTNMLQRICNQYEVEVKFELCESV